MEKKIRIELKSFDSQLINESCNQISENLKQTNSTISGPIALPTKKRIYCVLRSPHVNKDSREHFEIRIHKRIIDIYEPSSQTIDSLMKLDLPSGVDISVVI